MILPQTTEDVVISVAGGDVWAGYAMLDELTLWLSVGLAGVLMVRWMLGGGRDPLRSAPERPHQITHETIAFVMLGYLGAGLFLSAGWQALDGDTEDRLAGVLLGGAIQVMGLAISLWLLADRFAQGMRRFWLGPAGSSVRLHAYTFFAVLLLSLGLCPLVLEFTVYLVERVAPGFKFATHPTIEMLHDEPARKMIVTFLWVGAAVVAPLAEEVFFRGLLQTFLTKMLPGRWSAIAVVSVAFGAVHFGQPQAIPALLLLSVLIGFAYERTGSMVVAASIHATFNLKTLVWDASLG